MKESVFAILLLAVSTLSATETKQREYLKIGGVYPHLTTYGYYGGEVRNLDECGIGAVVPWAGRLWFVNYAAHKPLGSDHKLYSIDGDFNLTIHPESVGGTPAGRMIHRESEQLFIGHYVVDAKARVRAIQPSEMPGRITAIARHLDDPANKVYHYDMEGMLYEVDVNTLDFNKLFHKPVPGWHGKGAYTGQDRLVVSNNGEHVASSFRNGITEGEANGVLKRIKAKGPEERGVLAAWDGSEWEVVERRQYMDVVGPGGLYGNRTSDDPLWVVGWDRRSIRLKILEDGEWSTFLLPKASYNNDAEHGWYTEWSRIRKVGNEKWMMDMHGMFFDFPETFSRGDTSGLLPIASHLRYVPDFADWNGQLVLASNETSVQGNPKAGQSQSNLWFGSFDDLREWGPTTAYGGPWSSDRVKRGQASDPFLVNGFSEGSLHLRVHDTGNPVEVSIYLDREGKGDWQLDERVVVDEYKAINYPHGLGAQWVKLSVDRDCVVTAHFHLSNGRYQDGSRFAKLFAGLADVDDEGLSGYTLYAEKSTRGLSVSDLEDENFTFRKEEFNFAPREGMPSELRKELSLKKPRFSVDEASVVLDSWGERLRLPKGNERFDRPFAYGWPRDYREVQSERELANIHGTFYEVPLELNNKPPVFQKMRPVSSHRLQLSDFCSWNGLLALVGLADDAAVGERIYKDDSGKAGVWFGGIDDLWKLGKPVGRGGPWKDALVAAEEASNPYLMTGYDRKRVTMKSNEDAIFTLEVSFDHNGWSSYKSFRLKKGESLEYVFPKGFSAHWVRVRSDVDCRATAWFVYD